MSNNKITLSIVFYLLTISVGTVCAEEQDASKSGNMTVTSSRNVRSKTNITIVIQQHSDDYQLKYIPQKFTDNILVAQNRSFEDYNTDFNFMGSEPEVHESFIVSKTLVVRDDIPTIDTDQYSGFDYKNMEDIQLFEEIEGTDTIYSIEPKSVLDNSF